MFVLILTDAEGEEHVLNVLNCDDEKFVGTWVRSYLETQIKSLEYAPAQKYEGTISYIIEESLRSFVLFKVVERMYPGYIYSSKEVLQIPVTFIKPLQFDSGCIQSLQFPTLHDVELPMMSMKFDLNTKALRKMDANNMYKLIVSIYRLIQTKATWYRQEFTEVMSQIIDELRIKAD